MGLGRMVAIAGLAVVAAVAYGVYTPDDVDHFSPQLGFLAHRGHGLIWHEEKRTAGAPCKDNRIPTAQRARGLASPRSLCP